MTGPTSDERYAGEHRRHPTRDWAGFGDPASSDWPPHRPAEHDLADPWPPSQGPDPRWRDVASFLTRPVIKLVGVLAALFAAGMAAGRRWTR